MLTFLISILKHRNNLFCYFLFLYFSQYISHIFSNNSKSQHLFLIFKSNDDNSLSGLWNILYMLLLFLIITSSISEIYLYCFCNNALYNAFGSFAKSKWIMHYIGTGIILLKLITPYEPFAILWKSFVFFIFLCFTFGDDNGT